MEASVTTSPLARLYRGLCSCELAVLLFLAIGILAIPGTASSSLQELCSPVRTVLIALMGVSTFACTAKRVKTLPRCVLVIHAGVILTLAGAVLSSFGSVATVNVYEGKSVTEAYRWDLKADAPLGFELLIKKIGMEYYPAPVRIGVLKGEDKVGLFTLATGESFEVGGLLVTVRELDTVGKRARLDITQGGQLIGSVDTSAAQQMPAGFPYAFRLVSYKTPKVKRTWVDLALMQGAQTVAQGTSEVNSPLRYGSLDLFHVQTSRDPSGNGYAGIQLVRDPGRPVVFAGLALVSLGALWTAARRLRNRG